MATVSKKAEFLTYSDAEVAAIAVLEANRGVHLSAKELGISNIVLTNLIKKANDERPMAEGVTRVMVNKEDYNAVCSECGAKISHKLYWIEG